MLRWRAFCAPIPRFFGVGSGACWLVGYNLWMASGSTAIMWFRRDLRLADHPALCAAAAEHDVIVPVFVVDPAFARAGAPRRAFLHDCLTSLDTAIGAQGGRLVIRHGDPVEMVPQLANEVDATAVYVTRDYGPYGRRRDGAVGTALAAHERALRGVGSPYAVMPGGVRKDDGTPYAVFTPFSKRWRAHGWDAPLDVPSDVRWGTAQSDALADRPDPGCDLPSAGEDSAHDRWATFLGDGLDRYADDRDTPSVIGTSQLSPALRWGTIHPRQLLADLDASGAGSKAHTVFSS